LDVSIKPFVGVVIHLTLEAFCGYALAPWSATNSLLKHQVAGLCPSKPHKNAFPTSYIAHIAEEAEETTST
jgi:hypothetical protein